jgi:hypothetical protein
MFVDKIRDVGGGERVALTSLDPAKLETAPVWVPSLWPVGGCCFDGCIVLTDPELSSPYRSGVIHSRLAETEARPTTIKILSLNRSQTSAAIRK